MQVGSVKNYSKLKTLRVEDNGTTFIRDHSFFMK